MKQFLTVLKFELGNYFQNKSFLITTLIIALLAIGAVAIPPQIPGLLSKDTVTSMVEGIDETSRVGIVDADDVLYQQLPELTGLPEEVWVEYGSEEELNQKIQSTEGTYIEKSKEVLSNGQETEGAQYETKVLNWQKKLFYGVLRIIIRPLRQLL